MDAHSILAAVLSLSGLDPSPTTTPERAVQSALLSPVGAAKTGFTTLHPPSLGIAWTNSIPLEEYLRRQNLMQGAGLALGDYDDDGWCDIFLCNRYGPSALYRNLSQWRFENVTEKTGVACSNQLSAGAVFADINGDRHLDLVVSSFTGPNALFLNRGNGSFTNITAHAGITSTLGGTSLALGDLDGDRDLDLYLCHLGVEAIFRDGATFSTRMVRGKPVVTGRYARRLEIVDGRIFELGDTDYLFRNLGQGQFAKVPWKEVFADHEGTPVDVPYDMGLAVQIRDMNGDSLPDIYTCNDFQTPDRLWLNQGEGRFRSIPPFAVRNMSYASMGVDFADVDRDGHLEFITVEMLSPDHRRRMRQASAMGVLLPRNHAVEKREDVPRNAFYWNRGDGTYAEIAWFSRLAASDWSWTPIFMDVDLDGFEDLLISNGHLRDVNDRDATATLLPPPDQRNARNMQEAFRKYPELNTPNAAFRNLGNLKFQDVSEAWGFADPHIAHGMALADLDNDGDQDVVANRPNALPLICRNDSPAPRIAVRLLGSGSNSQGIGAQVTLHGGPFPQTQEIVSGGRYLAGDDPTRTFAIPSGSGPLSLEVRWPGGAISRIPGVQPNHRYLIPETTAAPAPLHPPPHSPRPLFQDLTASLNHTHYEMPFDDLIRQPFLPRMLGSLGPAAAWFDLDQDGSEELFIGGGKGGQLACYQNAAGTLKPISPSGIQLPDDSSSIVGWVQNRTPTLLVGMARFESPGPSSPPLLAGHPGTLAPLPELPKVPASTGPMAVADIDGDGDLDLFIGGRFLPGHYPAPVSSSLWLNESGRLTPHPATDALLRETGLVAAAMFTDLDQDGFAELVLACEWGPIRVLKNDRGSFTDATDRLGFAGQLGLWNSLASGDFDGDGRMDLVAGNWGFNSRHQLTPAGPWYLYYGDPHSENRHLILEAHYDPALESVVPMRDMDFLSSGFTWLKSRFATHAAYSAASVPQILGEFAPRFQEVKATTLASTIFWNRGDQFTPAPLPDQCQWTPLFGLNVADFNGDGFEDLFVAQNYFGVRLEDDRLDAGRGLLLAGSRSGQLSPIPGSESGLIIYGEQRGSAAADFDADGRTDLVVTQNSGPTRLFRNQSPTPGLRIRLQGPPGNPAGYGAILRWRMGGQAGPAREIHGGSGYWSLDGAIQVLHGVPPGADIIVRWPGGRQTSTPVPKDARQLIIRIGEP